MTIKIPSVINLDLGNNKSIVNDLIKSDGISKDVTQLALTVFCKEKSSNTNYEIVKFHSSKNIVHILSVDNNV